jgi:hypothetical protein
MHVSKDKKKKKKDKKNSAASPIGGLKSLSQNPLVADVVAAALVATAAAIKDSNKARKLAEVAGDEIEALAKEGAERGNAMWQLALDVGRRALETYAGDSVKPRSSASRAKARASRPAKASKSPKKTKRKSGATKAG